MEVWTFIWLMLILKIPIVGLLLLVRWAIRQDPEGEPASGEEGGIGPLPQPLHPSHPRHPRTPLPYTPRRGPHGEPALPSPPRVRTAMARARTTPR